MAISCSTRLEVDMIQRQCLQLRGAFAGVCQGWVCDLCSSLLTFSFLQFVLPAVTLASDELPFLQASLDAAESEHVQPSVLSWKRNEGHFCCTRVFKKKIKNYYSLCSTFDKPISLTIRSCMLEAEKVLELSSRTVTLSILSDLH